MKTKLHVSPIIWIVLIGTMLPYVLFGQSKHEVTKGQTLFSIARYYGLTVEQIKTANKLDSAILKVGQLLHIPQSATTAEDGYYEVRSGDTLFSLSERFEIPVDSIKEWNSLSENTLSVGQRLLISPPASDNSRTSVQQPDPDLFTISRPASNSTSVHVVKKGESLYRIARLYNMEIGQIKRLNQLKSNTLAIGQKLLITAPPSTKLSASAQTIGQRGAFTTLTISSQRHFESVLRQNDLSEAEVRALNPRLGNEIEGAKIAIYQQPIIRTDNPYLNIQGNSVSGKLDSTQKPNTALAIDVFSSSAMATALSSGELYNPSDFLIGHPDYAMGSILKFTNLSSGQTTWARVAHRSIGGILLSRALANEIGFLENTPISIFLQK